MAKLSVKIEAITKGLSAKLTSAQASFKKFGGSVKSIAVGVLGFGTAIGGSIFAIGKMGGTLAQTKIAMEAFLGSSEKATQLISDLRQFADVTPFDTNSILKAGKTLASVEKDVTKILPTIKMLGDISAGTGKDLNELTNIFVKMKNLGRVTFEELNQLANANIVSFDELAKSIGVKGKGALRKYIESGKVGFKDIVKLLKSATGEGGRFNDLMNKQSQTFIGRLSTLQGKLQNLATDIGGPLQNSLTSITDTFINWTDQAKLMRGPIGLLVKDLGAIATLLESTRDGGSLAKATGLKDFGVTDLITDSLIGTEKSIGDNPLAGIGAGMKLLGFGSEAKGEQAMFDSEVADILRSIDNNTSNKRF